MTGLAQQRQDSDDTVMAADTTSTQRETEKVEPTRSRSDSDYSSESEHHQQRDDDLMQEDDRTELRRIATDLYRRRSSVAAGNDLQLARTLTVIDENDPAIDPDNSSFSVEKWVKNFVRHVNEKGIERKGTGVSFRNLNVYGSGSALQIQQTVGSFLTAPLRPGEFFSLGKKDPKHILHDFDGLLRKGELLIVLGRPGSGCSTLLKSLTGELHGLALGDKSTIHFNGVPQKQMQKEFRGETVYNQEVDRHFPHLTVGETLQFAAAARVHDRLLEGSNRTKTADYISRVVMAMFGLSHTYNTKVGDDFVRGVSGGERKRVSIAEMFLAGSPIAAWDNSTRGLDAATALKFTQSVRMASNIGETTSIVAIYQASQAIYDLFDKVTVLYEGRQIYFGSTKSAKQYFEAQGWFCPARQTTGDFLTSITNPSERQTREGFDNRVPRTPEEFEQRWRDSQEYAALQRDLDAYEAEFSGDGQQQMINQMRELKNQRQGKHVRPESPYTVSIPTQLKLNVKRAWQRIWNDKAATLTQIFSNVIIALIIGSIFYGTPNSTSGFFAKGSVLFLAILLNALMAIGEIVNLYAQRPIVEKQRSYAFYHPATEAAAGIILDIPIKFMISVAFNLVLYFLSNLRREPGPFFLFFLITYMSTFVMSAVFRTMAALTKTVSQAMALSGVLILALVIYTGFAITVPDMHPWFSWIRWINPIFYAFEILIANEFHGQEFSCGSFVPPYPDLTGNTFVCDISGAEPGQRTVSGDAFIQSNYQYSYSHVWRNFGILWAFLIGFMAMYFVAVELNSNSTSTAEALVFQRGHVPAHLQKNGKESGKDVESTSTSKVQSREADGEVNALPPQKDIFTWRDVVYDIEIKGNPRRLLDHVDGWVKPGTLTALMGVSGAGKTTLLDVLAERTTMGVITGDMLVNGKPRDPSFQRKTGYVQQQDLHLETATVRESLRFSAMLRQPSTVSKQEKYEFVEEVIKMLNMEDFANAVVGVPGEGLNVEQRKLLTIGVELAAKPALLLFLDEPTSGLDSQSSWAICAFLRKLADSGQAILCTVHQPSAILFQSFDRLLFLARGGKTVYFGDIGENSRTLLDYFEANGARDCDDQENPAEYMLEIVNAGKNNKGKEWNEVWNDSQEKQAVKQEIERLHREKEGEAVRDQGGKNEHAEFAMPFSAQLWAVTYRVFQQYWRQPSYIFAKFALGIAAGLFIGFTFYDAKPSLAGMQNVQFSVFMVSTIFSTLVQQIQPLFVTQRSLYEVRERPSKAYSWVAFIISNVLVEIPYQIITGILIYACFYYPVVGIQGSNRQGLVLLFVVQLFIYASSFAQMTIAALPDAQTASAIVTLLTMMITIFNGVLQQPNALPGFWIFMYRVSPFTYWIGGIVATMLHDRQVVCAEREVAEFSPPSGQTCGQYLSDYLQQSPGYLEDPNATSDCRFCSISVADQYLAGPMIFWTQRWRNYGIMWAFIAFNIFIAVATYWAFRVKKWNGPPKFRLPFTGKKAAKSAN